MSKKRTANKCIAICGSHGVGKSTLLDELNFENRIREIAREVIAQMGKPPQEMSVEEKEKFEFVTLQTQLFMEKYHSIVSGGFVSDRSVLDVLAYSYYLLGGNSKEYEVLKTIVKNTIGYHKVYYIPIEFPLVTDGVRFEGEQFQHQIDEKIKELANEFGIELIEVRGTVEERKNFILKDLGEE